MHAELNAMLARSEQERLIFDHLDRTLAWPEPAGAGNLLARVPAQQRFAPDAGQTAC